MLVPSVISFMIFSDMVKEQYVDFVVNSKSSGEVKTVTENNDGTSKEVNGISIVSSEASKIESNTDVAKESKIESHTDDAKGNEMMPGKGELSSGGCGSGCGGGNGNVARSGGCGAGCGGGCGNMVASGGCGGCGGGGQCGNMVNSGGCGGCGGGCGGCGSGCGNLISSSGCGGCGGCGGGCGGCGAKFAQSDNPCADAHSKKLPTLQVNEAVAA